METKPIIICAGTNGRAVVFGYHSEPVVPGKPVTLYDARMVLYWPEACGGLFGLAANGPKAGLRLTHAVIETTITQWKESIVVEPDVAQLMDGWA